MGVQFQIELSLVFDELLKLKCHQAKLSHQSFGTRLM